MDKSRKCYEVTRWPSRHELKEAQAGGTQCGKAAKQRLRVQEDGGADVLDAGALNAVQPPDLMPAQGQDAGEGEVRNPGHSPHRLAFLGAVCIRLVDP